MIMYRGERDVEFFTDGFRKKKVVAQVANVGRVLLSADKLAQAGNEENLSKSSQQTSVW